MTSKKSGNEYINNYSDSFVPEQKCASNAINEIALLSNLKLKLESNLVTPSISVTTKGQTMESKKEDTFHFKFSSVKKEEITKVRNILKEFI